MLKVSQIICQIINFCQKQINSVICKVNKGVRGPTLYFIAVLIKQIATHKVQHSIPTLQALFSTSPHPIELVSRFIEFSMIYYDSLFSVKGPIRNSSLSAYSHFE